jgi:hypothetical protein
LKFSYREKKVGISISKFLKLAAKNRRANQMARSILLAPTVQVSQNVTVVGGGETVGYRYYTYNSYTIVCYIMDNANTISTSSESYFALAWCSESDDFSSVIQITRVNPNK